MAIGVLGTLLLLVVTLLGRSSRSTQLRSITPAEERPVRTRGVLVALGVSFLWMVGAHFWLPLPLAYLNTTSAQVTSFCLEHLHESQPIPGEYILIIEGSSVTSRGVNGGALERLLRAAGVPVTVLQLSLSGANHLERLQLLQNFANSSFSAMRCKRCTTAILSSITAIILSHQRP